MWRYILAILFFAFLMLHGITAIVDGRVGYSNGCVWYHVDNYVYNWVIVSFRYILIWSVMTFVFLWVGVVLHHRRGRSVSRILPPLGILTFIFAGCLGISYGTSQTNFDYKNFGFILMILILLMLAVWRYDLRVARLFDDAPAWRWWPFLAAVFGCTAMLISHYGLYCGQIVVTDSQSQIAQARLLASGHFVLDIPQRLRDVISFPYAINSVPSYSQYTPGYILPLALLCLCHLPLYAFDCLFSGAFVGILAWLTRRLRGNAASCVAVCILLTTPFYLIIAGSLMNHLFSALLLLTVFALLHPCVLHPRRVPSSRACFVVGLALGWAVLVRPLTGMTHLAIWGCIWIALLWNARTDRPAMHKLMRSALAIICGGAIPLFILVVYNLQTTGHPFVTGYQISNPELHRLGFHGGTMPYSPLDAWNRLASTILWANFLIIGLGIGLLVWITVWLALTRMSQIEKLLLLIIFAQITAYSMYQYYDLLLGPRFLFDILPFVILLFVTAIVPRRLPSTRTATLILGAFLFLAAGQFFLGKAFAIDRYNYFVKCNSGVCDRIERCIAENPDANPLVIILKDETETEMIGKYFSSGKIWFIRKADLPAARAVPELRDARFVSADQNIPLTPIQESY